MLRSWESFLYHVQCLRYESNELLPISAANCGVTVSARLVRNLQCRQFHRLLLLLLSNLSKLGKGDTKGTKPVQGTSLIS